MFIILMKPEITLYDTESFLTKLLYKVFLKGEYSSSNKKIFSFRLVT